MRKRKQTRIANSLQFERLEDRLALAVTTLLPASVISGSQTTGNNASLQGVTSADGRFTAYVSESTNLVPGFVDGNGNGFGDVFLFDNETGQVKLVSRVSGNGNETKGANAYSGRPVISADGNFILFESEATNLVAGQVDAIGGMDLFLYERLTGQTTLVSRAAGPANNLAADGRSGNSFGPASAALSANGQFVAFYSLATNMVPGFVDGNGFANGDVFLFNRAANTVTLMSAASDDPLVSSNSDSFAPVLSADGRFAAYTSYATNVVAGQNDGNNQADVFLFDRDAQSNRNKLVSGALGSATETANGATFADLDIDISDNGLFVAFRSFATNLVSNNPNNDTNNNADLFLFNRQSFPGSNIQLISHEAGNLLKAANGLSEKPTISGNGQFVAYQSPASNLVAPDSNGQFDVFLFDRTSGINTLVSHAHGSANSANGESANAFISNDGNFVGYASAATNLVLNQIDSNNGFDVFLYDREAEVNTLESGAGGSTTQTAAGFSIITSITSDGLGTVFTSTADNLAGVDQNDLQDVFVKSTKTARFSFRADSFTTEESSGRVRLRIDRTGDLSAPAFVDLQLTEGTAKAGADFVSFDETLFFEAGEESQVVFVTILNDFVPEGDERFTAQLVDPDVGSRLGTPSEATIKIQANDELGIVSHAPNKVSTGNHPSDAFFTSDDGRFVAFQSQATTLVSGFVDGNGLAGGDVFLLDRMTGITKLVSRKLGQATTGGNDTSLVRGISADGNRVLFETLATDLLASNADVNFKSDIYVFDRTNNAITPVSLNFNENGLANDVSMMPSISADGNFVFFLSLATNIVAPGVDANSTLDLYRRDLTAGETILVSRQSQAQNFAAAGTVEDYDHSSDGRYVVYTSELPAALIVGGQVADELRSGEAGSGEDDDLFWRDLNISVTQGTQLVTVKPDFTKTLERLVSKHPLISDDGRIVVFSTIARDAVASGVDSDLNEDIFVRDMSSFFMPVTSLVRDFNGVNAVPLDMTPDGRFIVYETDSTNFGNRPDANGAPDIFVYDREKNVVIPVSVNAGGTGMGNAASSNTHASRGTKLITDDGRFVVFESLAFNLDPATQDDLRGSGDNLDVFVRDLELGVTTLLSTNSDGSPSANRQSRNPHLNPRGQHVAFLSDATDIVAGVNDVNATGVDIVITPGAFNAGKFQFTDAEFSAAENGVAGGVLVAVERTGGFDGDVELVFAFQTVTAQANADFKPQIVNKIFPSGVSTFEFFIPIVDDLDVEETEEFKVKLTGPASLLGTTVETTVAISDNDSGVVENQITQEDNEVVAVTLKGPGTLKLSIDDPDGNGRGPIQVALTGTDPKKSTLGFKVTKANKGTDGVALVRSITSDAGLKSIAGAKVDLLGKGNAEFDDSIHVKGLVSSLVLRDVLNGADIKLGGTPTELSKIKLRNVQNGTVINVGSGIKNLTAAQIGDGDIVAPNLQTLAVKGDKKAGLAGDMRSNVYLSGEGVSVGKNTLHKATIAHDMIDAVFAVLGGVGNIGTVATGRMIRSGISAGYIPDDLNLATPLLGKFQQALSIKSVTVKGVQEFGPAYVDSVIAASTIDTVKLKSINDSPPGTGIEYGILADVSIKKVKSTSPFFEFGPFNNPVDEVFSRFHIRVV